LHTVIAPKTQNTSTYFKYTIYDNPRLTEKQIEKAATLVGGKNSEAWKTEYLCEVIRETDIVCIPEYSDSLAVNFALETSSFEFHNYLVAIDVGGVRDKTVGLLLSFDVKAKTYYVHDERVFNRNTDSETIISSLTEMELSSNFTVNQHIADAPGQLIIDWQSKYDYQCNLPLKDDLLASIDLVRKVIRDGKLKINDKCTFLLDTLKLSRYNQQRKDLERSDYLGHCDGLMALVYGLRMIDKETDLFPKPKKEFDMVRRIPVPEGKAAVAQLFGKKGR
jgi:hypothetical protein